MNWLDIVLLIVIVASVVASMTKGFSREVIGLIAAVAALFAGLWFYGTVGSFLLPYVSTNGVANFCGFVIVFFGVIVAGALVSIIAGHLIKATGLSFIDRLFGVVFGLGRGMVIAVAIVLAILTFAPGVQAGSPPASVSRSRLAPYMVEAARVLTAIAPRELKDEFAQRYEMVKKIWKDALRGKKSVPSPTEN